MNGLPEKTKMATRFCDTGRKSVYAPAPTMRNMDSKMPYYRKPEQHLPWVAIPVDQDIRPGWRLAPYCKLPIGHPVTCKLIAAGLGAGMVSLIPGPGSLKGEMHGP